MVNDSKRRFRGDGSGLSAKRCEIAHGGRGYIWLSSERGSPLLTLDTASRYRHLFPVFDRVTYINSCSQGALAYQVRAALDEYLDGMESEGALWDLWVTKQEEVRGLIAKVFGTSESKVAVTPSASAALNSLMSAFDFSRGRKKIVTTSLEFPTLGQIAHAQELRGARVVHIAAEPDNTLDLAKLEKAIDEDTALIAVTHVCYRNGAMTDI
ncbi:MAG: aminotransferase class V-fold PLP-dependent enzyme, partial [Actinobacteria bacterium]|nr:aminotransferase class V-fold PLP-dependent enzyme [Actinomycetota bacterium]